MSQGTNLSREGWNQRGMRRTNAPAMLLKPRKGGVLRRGEVNSIAAGFRPKSQTPENDSDLLNQEFHFPSKRI